MIIKSVLVTLSAAAFTLSAQAAESYRPYASVGAQLASISATAEMGGVSDKNSSTFYGGGLSAGTYFGDGLGISKGAEFDEWASKGVHQVGLEVDVLMSSETDDGIKEDDLIVPILVSYNYNFILPDNIGWIYVGPSVGMLHFDTELSSGGVKVSASDTAFAFGAQVGAKFPVSKHLTIDAGYRYLRTTDMTMDFGLGFEGKLKNIGGHFFNVGVTYVF
jgi:opacity protein-like surface antigen